MQIILVGGGKEIHYLTKSFIDKGNKVTIVNNNKEYCRELARQHAAAMIVHGDGTKPFILKDAGADYANMLIALTQKDQDNLVICQIAQKRFKVKKTAAVVNNPENIKTFKKLGIDIVISTTNIISSIIEQRIALEDITNIVPIEEGDVSIIEVEVGEGYPVVGKMLSQIDIPKDSLIGCIVRDKKSLIPRGDTVIHKNDKLVLITLTEAQSDVLKIVRGRID